MHVRACKKKGPGDNFTGFANRTILQACSPGLFNLSIKKTRQAPQLSKLKMIGTKITTIIKGQLGIFIVFLFIFLFYSFFIFFQKYLQLNEVINV